MKVVINHLTRMEKGYFCAAGIEMKTGAHVRPVLRGGKRCGTGLLACNGGHFGIARIVEFSRIKHVPNPPEIEDHLFEPKDAESGLAMDPVNFWKLLSKSAKTGLSDIFGNDLKPHGDSSAAVDMKKGKASLGCFMPTLPIKMYLRPSKEGPRKIRMKVKDKGFDLDLSVTDLRLYNADYTPNTPLVRKLSHRIENCAGVILGVGLTRPYAKDKTQQPVHWLQVNSIHTVENPVW